MVKLIMGLFQYFNSFFKLCTENFLTIQFIFIFIIHDRTPYLLFFQFFYRKSFVTVQEILVKLFWRLKIKYYIKMIEYFVSIFIILAVYAFYAFYYSPKKTLQWYKDTLEGLGYKVKMHPFKLLGAGFLSNFLTSTEKHDAFYSYKMEFQQYDCLLYNTVGTPVVQIFNAELMKGFFQPDNIYIHHKMIISVQNIRRSLGYGIAFSEGKEWKRKRNVMNAVFNYDFITENIPKIIRICNDAFKVSEQECQAKGDAVEKDGKITYKFHLYEIFATLSNVMLECFFGTNSTHQKINNQSINSFVNTLNSDLTYQGFELTTFVLGTKFLDLGLRKRDRDINNRIKIWKEFAKSSIEKRLKQLQKSTPREKYQDVVEALVYLKSLGGDKASTPTKLKFNKQQADNYDFKELTEEFCTFFTAGTDTATHFTQMMVYYISRNKQIQQKLRKQIEEVIQTDEDITKENLKKLTYIDWIQNETTRYYGPGNGVFTRIAQKDHYIGNVPILKGSGVNCHSVPNHFNQKYYIKPLQFRPQRWESECENNHPFAFMGFSGGPRACIGKHLALLESKIALLIFVKKYKSFKPLKDHYKMIAKFTYEPQFMEFYVSKQE